MKELLEKIITEHNQIHCEHSNMSRVVWSMSEEEKDGKSEWHFQLIPLSSSGELLYSSSFDVVMMEDSIDHYQRVIELMVQFFIRESLNKLDDYKTEQLEFPSSNNVSIGMTNESTGDLFDIESRINYT
jgi:hypothetical protein